MPSWVGVFSWNARLGTGGWNAEQGTDTAVKATNAASDNLIFQFEN